MKGLQLEQAQLPSHGYGLQLCQSPRPLRLRPIENFHSCHAEARCWPASATPRASMEATRSFFMCYLLSPNSSTQAATHRERVRCLADKDSPPPTGRPEKL